MYIPIIFKNTYYFIEVLRISLFSLNNFIFDRIMSNKRGPIVIATTDPLKQ